MGNLLSDARGCSRGRRYFGNQNCTGRFKVRKGKYQWRKWYGKNNTRIFDVWQVGKR